MNQNLRWKLLAIFGIFVIFFTLGVYPVLAPRKAAAPGLAERQQLKLDSTSRVCAPRPRVQTGDPGGDHDDAEQIREEMTANIPVGPSTQRPPRAFTSRVCRRIGMRTPPIVDTQGTTCDRQPGGRAYDFTMSRTS